MNRATKIGFGKDARVGFIVDMMRMRYNIGTAIVLVGQPVIWVLRDWIGTAHSQTYSIAFLLTGLLLIFSPTTLARGRLYGNALSIFLPALFLIPATSFAIYAGLPYDNNAFYMLFTLVFLIVLLTVPYERLGRLPGAALGFSAFACFLSLLEPIFGGITLIGQRFAAGDSNSPIQLSLVGGVAVLSGFFLLAAGTDRSGVKYLLNATSILLGATVIILTQTRSTILGLMLCAGLFFLVRFVSYLKSVRRQRTVRNNRLFTKLTIFVFLSAAACAIYFTPIFDVMSVYGPKFIDYYQRGILSYVLGVSTGEESSESRIVLLKEAFAEMDLLVGNGYQSKSVYLHFPLIQAYFDLGLAGGIVFTFGAFILPLFVSLKVLFSKKSCALSRFCSYFYILYLPNLMLHGHPYSYIIWLPIVLMYGTAFRFVSIKKVRPVYEPAG